MIPEASGASPAADVTRDRPLPILVASFWIGWFSFREMVRRRRLLALGLVMLLPVLVAFGWRVWDPTGTISAPLLLANLGGVLYVHFLIALVALGVGLSAIGEQVEEGTIIYYWTRPLSRSGIYLGRLVAAQSVAAGLLVASLAVCFLVMTAGNLGVLSVHFVKLYAGLCLVVLIGTCVYTAIFVFLGTWLRRPMFLAVLYAFGWESLGGNVPLKLQELTVVFHLRNLIRNAEEGTRSVPNLLTEIKRALLSEQPVPQWHSLLTLVAVWLVATGLGILLLRRKEIFR
jgi:hypothetical protein